MPLPPLWNIPIMRLRSLPTAALMAGLLVLAGCDQSPTSSNSGSGSAGGRMMAPAAATMKVADVPNGPKLAYHHWLEYEMPAASVAPRYARARDKCLADTANCVLVNASIDAGDPRNGRPPHAGLTMRVPHDAVAAVEQGIAAPVPGEAPGAIELRSRNTSADDLTTAIQDVDRRLAQLTDYRDRLTALAKRADAKVEDLIKVEQELSNTQSQIETITAQQKHLNEQVATELLTINLAAEPTPETMTGPIGQVWRNAGTVLGQNTAAALHFAIGAVPWLVIAAVAFTLLAVLRQVFRRRRRA
ncbi:hypothetical protein GCM10011611_13560 [Aliidongia dinghuensis]|uniref:DUF4349 domain-containing protein n=1 Tax=Aliidongia dinghuensis TaxID=1867774 RepID=A0A8J2YS97_9PROT|nr:DUF4349 domain-containing protein [Aliidongia dinghuensis]GGF09349.1 hypothetical protein GCM10011611_13560 [Aliidongia dinghuensis]